MAKCPNRKTLSVHVGGRESCGPATNRTASPPEKAWCVMSQLANAKHCVSDFNLPK